LYAHGVWLSFANGSTLVNIDNDNVYCDRSLLALRQILSMDGHSLCRALRPKS
jgi:hypothetical protein